MSSKLLIIFLFVSILLLPVTSKAFDVGTTPPELRTAGTIYRDTYSISLSDNKAYVSNGNYGISIIDVKKPTHPKLLGVYNGEVSDFALSGKTLFVASGSTLTSVNVSKPSSPKVLNIYEAKGEINKFKIINGKAYIVSSAGDYYEGFSTFLEIVDVNDSTMPSLEAWTYLKEEGTGWASYYSLSRFENIFISGTSAWLIWYTEYCAGWKGCGNRTYYIVFDIGKFNLFGEDLSGYLNSKEYDVSGCINGGIMNLYDNRAIYSVGNCIQSFIYTGYDSKTKNHIEKHAADTVTAMTAAGNKLYVAEGASGVEIFDKSDDSSLELLGSIDTPVYASDIKVSGRYAYVADGKGLIIIDINEPSSPKIISKYGIKDKLKQPDLVVKEVSVQKTMEENAITLTVKCKIQNIGEMTASPSRVVLSLYPNNDNSYYYVIGNMAVDKIAKKAFKNITFKWNDPESVPAGTYYIKVLCDYDKQIIERSENNNISIAEKTVEIK
ncbi:MAG: hypothetical protein HZA77_05300 [Candidatus Schekmanbacteria bacterium]|nr:hypothetical protein [Candidatus Schekmanbacteria bacterium]